MQDVHSNVYIFLITQHGGTFCGDQSSQVIINKISNNLIIDLPLFNFNLKWQWSCGKRLSLPSSIAVSAVWRIPLCSVCVTLALHLTSTAWHTAIRWWLFEGGGGCTPPTQYWVGNYPPSLSATPGVGWRLSMLLNAITRTCCHRSTQLLQQNQYCLSATERGQGNSTSTITCILQLSCSSHTKPIQWAQKANERQTDHIQLFVICPHITQLHCESGCWNTREVDRKLWRILLHKGLHVLPS